MFHRASFSFKSFLAYNTYDKVMPFSLCHILEDKALDSSLRKMNLKKRSNFGCWAHITQENQHPITWSKQLPRTRVTAFSPTSLPSYQIDMNLEYHVCPWNHSARPRELKVLFLSFQWRLVLLFDILFFECPHWRRGTFYLHRKKCSTMYLKINRLVKTAYYGVAHSSLWAPDKKPV